MSSDPTAGPKGEHKQTEPSTSQGGFGSFSDIQHRASVVTPVLSDMLTHQSPPQPAKKDDVQSSEDQHLRILHLEDDSLVSDVVQIKLNWLQIPFHFRRAATKEEFEAALQKNSFDLIISDSQLPNFDTYYALMYVRDRHPNIPFVFFSSSAKPKVKEQALAWGAADYVSKHNLSELIPVIQRVCPRAAFQKGGQKAK